VRQATTIPSDAETTTIAKPQAILAALPFLVIGPFPGRKPKLDYTSSLGYGFTHPERGTPDAMAGYS
jgi:hypothetical protein